MNNNFIDSVKSFLINVKKNKKTQYFIIFFLVIVIAFCFFFSNNKESKTVKTEVDEVTAYVLTLEERLSKVLSKVTGAGDVSVVITVQSGKEIVLAMKTVTTKTSTGSVVEETPIIVNGKTVVLKELYPKVIGVLIVAEGADNIAVRSKLQQATISLLDIELNQIEILTSK